MKRRITVTQEDIGTGKRKSSTACPVARALRRVAPEALVGGAYWMIGTFWSGRSVTYKPLPASVMRFIKDFDARQPVQPFTFYVEVPK